MAKTNRDIALEYVDVMWNQHDLERGITYLTPKLAESGAIAHVTQLFDAFPDVRVDVLEPGAIADGDYVVLRLGAGGTHTSADFAGQPPSGRHITWESIRIFRFENGKISATWAMQDRLALMEQIGAIESTAADGVHWAADTDSGS